MVGSFSCLNHNPADAGESALPGQAGSNDIERLTKARLSRGWSDCYGRYLVAPGQIDVMVDPRMHAWDNAPLLPIVVEAGGLRTPPATGDRRWQRTVCERSPARCRAAGVAPAGGPPAGSALRDLLRSANVSARGDRHFGVRRMPPV
jgi:hypothetical protein